LKGFLEYRKQLKECGLEKGVQWIDGSFLEDIENNKNRPPNDIDLVTIIMRPEQFSKDHLWKDFIGGKIELFNPSITKANYNCDAYLVDFCLPFDYVLRQITYWHGLFSHQRVTKIWKGILQIDLAHDEEESLRFVNNLGVDNA
jgi:hypothetical protein